MEGPRLETETWADPLLWSSNHRRVHRIVSHDRAANYRPGPRRAARSVAGRQKTGFHGGIESCSRLAVLINSVELELNQDKLLLTMVERSGSIWMLDNVDH